jgi:CDP-paratose 2-epimerase
MMKDQFILITGGAGFIGTNIALSYLEQNRPVHIFDNLSRTGVAGNVRELLARYPGRVLFTRGDVRDGSAVRSVIASARLVYHLAAQVAVTISLDDPIADLETNLAGTLNVLEAIRNCPQRPAVLFTSTNKVYGHLSRVDLREEALRYEPADPRTARTGVAEDQPLEFLSPYGCSKGSADQYVLDYAHSYGIRAIVFRMGCIYGEYQFGSEDQGWVAHFVRQAMKRDPITIYGDGKQVRDLLHVSDLVRAMHLAEQNVGATYGQAFNVGGGPNNSMSLLELITALRQLTDGAVRVNHGPERLADQKWYVSDISKIRSATGWSPAVSIWQGISLLKDWYLQRPELIHRPEMQVVA